jgi:hypothetical protein
VFEVDLFDSENAGFVHPENLLNTMTREEMESAKQRLTLMDRRQRVADRELLLAK